METSRTPTPAPRRRAAFIGALIGSLGLIAALLTLSATAGADAPALQSQVDDPAPEVVEDVDAADLEDVENFVIVEGDEDFELPEEFAAAEACWMDVESSFGLDELEGEVSEDSIDWDALDAEMQKCEELLPEDVLAQIAIDDEAWEAYDTCISEALDGLDAEFGIAGEVFEGDLDELEGDVEMFEFGPAVSIMDGDTFSFAEFGEGDGSITITKSGDDITVTSDGDVEVIDEDVLFDDAAFAEAIELDDEMMQAYDDAFAGCEDALPEGIEDGIFFDDGVVAEEIAPLEDAELAES